MYFICTYPRDTVPYLYNVRTSVPDPEPLGSVNFELSRSGSGSVIIVPDPDPYSFLATLFIKMI
jgi:hypothetical protein